MPTESSPEEENLVSIICRSIGRSELEQTLKSVAAQTYSPIELILVDAAVKDLSEFETYCGSVPVITASTGKPLQRSQAANLGLDAANGKYLMFLDDDDWIANDHIENLVQFLNTQTAVQAVYSSTQTTDAEGIPLDFVFDYDFDRLVLQRDNFIPLHSMLFERSLLEHGCRFDESFDIYEDWDFWLQLSQHTDFHHLDKKTAFYRQGGQSETLSDDVKQRYDNENQMGKARAALFDKWLKLWSGADLNQMLGAMDHESLLSELGDKIDEMNTSLYQHQGQITDLTSSLADAIARLADANTRLTSAHQLIEESSQGLLNKEAELHNLRDQKDAIEDSLKVHISNLENALNSVLNSTSWKLMAPFRRFGIFVKRIFGAAFSGKRHVQEITGDDKRKESEQDPDPDLESLFHFSIDEAIFCSGYVYLRGWAVAQHGISNIRLICDGRESEVLFGLERSEIEQLFPHFPNSDTAGFFSFQQADSCEMAYVEFEDVNGNLVKAATKILRTDNLAALSNRAEFVKLDESMQYPIYLVERENSQNDRQFPVDSLVYCPLISIIIPTYNVDGKWLDACVNSVLNQVYDNWELCLYDDASTMQSTLDSLARWETHDKRIKIEYGKKNLHISGASNKALKMATGEFVGLMDNDDELTEDALFHVADLLNLHRNADYIYSDEDKIDEDGNYCTPHFKPDWSPELLESMMYVGHFSVIRKSVLLEAGGFREGFEGSQDYDLTLRITEITNAFYHIPRVLYHWRIIPGSVSGGSDAKLYAIDSAVAALQDYIARNDSSANVETTEYTGFYRVRRKSGNPNVSIVIPFHNKAKMTIDCLKSIENSTYENYSIFLISNNSDEDQYKKIQQFVSARTNIFLEKYDSQFNWAGINNWAAKKCDSEYIIFMNNDMKVISPDWIESMLDCGIKPNVGAVGAKLLYEDNTIQHAGIVMRIGGIAGHAFRYLPDDLPGYFGYAVVIRNCAAVTGACMLVRRSLFLQMGGFNESLRVAYNDVDFCLRLHEENYRVIYTPFAKLYHLESKTRPRTMDDMSSDELQEFQRESDYIRGRHSIYFANGDPFYNPNLTLKAENYSLNI